MCTHAQSAERGQHYWTERESSSKNHRRCNVKHKTKYLALLPECSAVESRVNNIKVVIVEGWKLIHLLTYYLRDDRGKSALFQTFITFFLNIVNTSKYTHIHKKESRIQQYYQRVMESSAAELRSLENARDSCCTLHILPILYMNPTGFI